MAASTSSLSDRTIEIVRVLKAPRELVFDAFTDRDHISSWWGPNGFTTTTSVKDVRPGGTWRFVMHGPDGTDYPNLITYTEVKRPERLRYDHGEPDGLEQGFKVTVTFDEVKEGTRVRLSILLASPEQKAKVAAFGAIEGGQQTLERLDHHTALAAAVREKRAFALTRIFEAPRDLVWTAWSESEALAEWWGPKGCKLHVAGLEFRPGGIFHYQMQYSNGTSMWGRMLFRETRKPERIRWLNSFANAEGGIARAPFSTEFPLEMENTVTLTGVSGKTRLELVALPFGATAPECRFFEGMFASLEQGFGGTMDQLAAYLTRANSQ